MRHDWDYARGSDVCVNCKSTAQSVVQLGLWDCPGPKPATQEPREWQSETGLWDRLRADLNNLGAAYGPVTEGAHEALASPKLVEICGCCKAAGGWHTWRCESGPHPASLYPDNPTNRPGCPPAGASAKPDPLLSQADRNAYFDGIILAARKKREAEESWNNIDPVAIDGGPICTYHERETQRRYVAKAMSRPLDWEPRVGHKGVEIE